MVSYYLQSNFVEVINLRPWLRTIRRMKRMTEQQVADAAGIAQPYYHRIETKGQAPSVKTAKAIAAALGFDWTLFFAEDTNIAN